MAGKKVRSWLGISDEAITEVAGITLKPYLSDPDVMFDACGKADAYFHREYGLRVPPRIPLHGWWSLALLDVHIEYPEDGWPHPMTRLARARDVERLVMPTGDFFAHPGLTPLVAYDKAVCAVTGAKTHIHDGITLGPVTFARTMRGDDFFIDLYESPDCAHKLLDFGTEFHLAFQRERRRYGGNPKEELMHIADDFAGMISPKMWPEFVLPYWRRIFEERGVRAGSRTIMLHSELMNPEQQMLAVRDLPINCIECGEDPNVTIEDMNATGLEYWWHVKALEMLNGGPDDVRRSFREAAEGGAPVVVSGVTHRHVPSENIRAFLEVSKEYA
ncbi:MAG: uroporphyrinogen decarboxylase family protein [Planctomycetota bacterium]